MAERNGVKDKRTQKRWKKKRRYTSRAIRSTVANRLGRLKTRVEKSCTTIDRQKLGGLETIMEGIETHLSRLDDLILGQIEHRVERAVSEKKKG